MEPVYSFQRYLQAKKTVDDRALNRLVWQALQDALSPLAEPVQWLELGCGTGTMLQRMLDWGLLRRAVYTGVDYEPGNIEFAQASLRRWAAERRLTCRTTAGWQQLTEIETRISFETTDLFDFVQRAAGQQWDLLSAHAVLDLLDVPAVLPGLFTLLRPGGLAYFTVNFDGLTLLEPPVDAQLDEHIQILYHRTMDERRDARGQPSGDSRSGRHLFSQLAQAGFEVLSAGSSDWVVYPSGGQYPAHEAYFLHFIVHFVEEALRDHADLDGATLAGWAAARHAQIERGELVYIAHQMDFLARRPIGDVLG